MNEWMLRIKQIFAAPGGPRGPGRLTHAAPRHIEEFHNFGRWRQNNILSARVRKLRVALHRLPRLHRHSDSFKADSSRVRLYAPVGLMLSKANKWHIHTT